eukprot:TRINITY_DN113139_c0_g1_i1.p1 TRINITY_DN113139_c0_g1~~TRINITY_DN113139_c0_g1_i1.p1  ORF type:complete len:383 (+),score=60.40 TRINITY_DN113139_c0_g1_i1:96-1151(+)
MAAAKSWKRCEQQRLHRRPLQSGRLLSHCVALTLVFQVASLIGSAHRFRSPAPEDAPELQRETLLSFVSGPSRASYSIRWRRCRSLLGARGSAGPRRALAEATPAELDNVTEGFEEVRTDIVKRIEFVQQDKNPDTNYIRALARLLVLLKAAEQITVREATEEFSRVVRESFLGAISNAVDGKAPIDVDSVTKDFNARLQALATTVNSGEVAAVIRKMDASAKVAVTSFTGKEDYEFGDITREIDRRAKESVAAFTGKADYEFGDITKTILNRTGDATTKATLDFTGKEEYEFGDITKAILNRTADATAKATLEFTGKEDYKFGDITKTVLGKIFGSDSDKKTLPQSQSET